MADQASVRNGNRLQFGPAPEGVFGSLAEFGNDVATLAELQARLALIDLKESTDRARFPLALILLGAALALACLPVALIGGAELLAEALGWSHGLALLAVAGIALVLAVVMVGVAAALLPRSFDSFRRSRDELTRNVNWLRTVIVHSGRSIPRRRP